MLIGVVQSSNNITVSFNLSTTSFECVNDFEWFKRCYFYIPVSCVSSTFYNIGLLCCSLTCYVRIQVLYASNYVIWIPAFFGYHVSFVFVSSCILTSSIRIKRCCISIQIFRGDLITFINISRWKTNILKKSKIVL